MLHDALAGLPPRAPDAPAFLPVDRVFAMPGHGTVLTGTLMQGTLRVGDTLRLDHPGREVRVRALQVFRERREAVDGGSRVAVNVPGLEVAETHRGAVLADAAFAPATALRVRFRALPEARALLRRRTPVRAYLGAAEILATLVFDALPADTVPVEAMLHLRRATTAFPGEAYVVRALTPKLLLGGGTVAGGAVLAGAPDAGHDLAAEPGDAPDVEAVARALAASGLAPHGAAELGARANVREERAAEILAELAARGTARRLQKPLAYVDGGAAEALAARVHEVLARREAEAPWMLGTTSLALARELSADEPFLIRLLASEAEEGRIGARAGYYATPAHRPHLSEEQRAFFERVAPGRPGAAAGSRPARGRGGRAAPGARHGALAGVRHAGRHRRAGQGRRDVYRGPQIAEIRRRLEAAIRRDGPITMARFRDAVGTSRKYAVPLMEWFDATGVTVRDGDLRALRQAKQPA